MNRQADPREPCSNTSRVGSALHCARSAGLTVGRQVKIGTIRGVIIGYNIASRGRYPGNRFPLLVKTELGVAKFGINEVVLA